MNTKERTLVMISIQGKGVSSGVGVGPLYFYHRTKTEIPRYTVTDPDAEWHRFKGAQTAAIEQLGELAEKARAEAGDEAAMLFETHQMMAEDLDYEEAISDHINNEKMNAEAAISDTAVQFAAMFESMDDSYMQARAADVRDVSDRILGILSGAVQGGIASDVPVLLAADDLAPSETVQLDKSKVLADFTAKAAAAMKARNVSLWTALWLGDLSGESVRLGGSPLTVMDSAENCLIKAAPEQFATRKDPLEESIYTVMHPWWSSLSKKLPAGVTLAAEVQGYAPAADLWQGSGWGETQRAEQIRAAQEAGAVSILLEQTR